MLTCTDRGFTAAAYNSSIRRRPNGCIRTRNAPMNAELEHAAWSNDDIVQVGLERHRCPRAHETLTAEPL